MRLTSIENLTEIQELARRGFDNWLQYGDVNVTARGDLLLFDYTTAAHMANRWNYFERVSRGLIINRVTGEIVARPFDKFFYWLDGGRRSGGHIVSVTEKLDGSLGILFRHKGEYHITTKGSFFSPQARWATQFLNQHYDLSGLPDELTLLFEIIYPDNRIVVDYAGREDLVLLAARNRFTGDYLPFFPDVYQLATRFGFSTPRIYQFNRITDILERVGKPEENFEGWVVEFSDGQRFKFKLDWYVEMHAIISNLSFDYVVKQVATGGIKHILNTLPEFYLRDVRAWVEEIAETVETLTDRTIDAYYRAPRADRETFLRWSKAHHPDLLPYLTAMFDEDHLPHTIYRHAFLNRPAQS